MDSRTAFFTDGGYSQQYRSYLSTYGSWEVERRDGGRIWIILRSTRSPMSPRRYRCDSGRRSRRIWIWSRCPKHNSIAASSTKAKAVRLQIFLAGKPELPISLRFSKIADHEYLDLALHEICKEMIYSYRTDLRRSNMIEIFPKTHPKVGHNVTLSFGCHSVPLHREFEMGVQITPYRASRRQSQKCIENG